MKNKISRIILSLEAIFICLPLTWLYVFKVIPAEFYFLGEISYEAASISIATVLVILSGLIAGWRLILAFIFYSGGYLVQLSKAWWLVTGVLAILSIASFMHASFSSSLNPSSFNAFGWGIFFVFPFAHLLFEYLRENSANKSPQSDV